MPVVIVIEVTQTIHVKDNTIPVPRGEVCLNTNISCAKDIPAVATITATDNCDENVAVQYSQVTSRQHLRRTNSPLPVNGGC